MGGAADFIKRKVDKDGLIWAKNRVFFDPKGRLHKHAGRRIIMQNPASPKWRKTDGTPQEWRVASEDDFYICYVREADPEQVRQGHPAPLG